MSVPLEIKLLYVYNLISNYLLFVIDQVVIRFLSPELFGLATQLEIGFACILSLSRKEIRAASLHSSITNLRITNEGLHATKSPQVVINLGYISIVLGVSLSVVLIVFLFTVATVQLPHFRAATVLYAVAAIVEILSEPAFLAAQRFMMYELPIQAHGLATFMQYTVICGVAIWAGLTGWNVGVLLVATGELCYSAVIAAKYLIYLGFISASNPSPPFSLLLTKVNE
jgi:Rft protein